MSIDHEDPEQMPTPLDPHAAPDVLDMTTHITEQTPPPPPAPTTLTGPKRGGGDLTTPTSTPAAPRTTRGGSQP